MRARNNWLYYGPWATPSRSASDQLLDRMVVQRHTWMSIPLDVHIVPKAMPVGIELVKFAGRKRVCVTCGLEFRKPRIPSTKNKHGIYIKAARSSHSLRLRKQLSPFRIRQVIENAVRK